MFTSSIKNTADGRNLLISISGVIVQSEYWDDETGSTQVTNLINEFAPTTQDEITVTINSGGGNYFAGVEIYNTLKHCDAKVITKNMGIAASAASLILMAGDERIAYAGTSTMTHDPLNGVYGNSSDLRAMADTLDEICESAKMIYIENGVNSESLVTLMKDETMMTPDLALEHGFITSVDNAMSVQNSSYSMSKEAKQLAIDNAFGDKKKAPPAPAPAKPDIDNKANPEFIMNSLVESKATEFLPHFIKNDFTEREINATLSSIVDVKNVCAASGVNFENVKDKVFNSKDLLSAFAAEILNNASEDIDSGSDSVEFSITPNTGI